MSGKFLTIPLRTAYYLSKKVLIIFRWHTKYANFKLGMQYPLKVTYFIKYPEYLDFKFNVQQGWLMLLRYRGGAFLFEGEYHPCEKNHVHVIIKKYYSWHTVSNSKKEKIVSPGALTYQSHGLPYWSIKSKGY